MGSVLDRLAFLGGWSYRIVFLAMALFSVASLIILYGVDHPIIFKGEMAKMFEDYGFEPKMAFWGIDIYYIWQVIIVSIMVLIAICYPMSKIFGMKVVNALRA